MTKRCPTCNQVTPLVRFNIRNSMSKRIYEFVSTHPHGVTANDIFEMLWGDDPDGGPIEGTERVFIMINTLNQKLRPHDLIVNGTKHNGLKHYALRRISTGNIWMPIA